MWHLVPQSDCVYHWLWMTWSAWEANPTSYGCATLAWRALITVTNLSYFPYLTSITDTITSCITDVLAETLHYTLLTVLTDNVKTALPESLPFYRDALVNYRKIKTENKFQFVITSVTENVDTHAGIVDTDSGVTEKINGHTVLKNDGNITNIRLKSRKRFRPCLSYPCFYSSHDILLLNMQKTAIWKLEKNGLFSDHCGAMTYKRKLQTLINAF